MRITKLGMFVGVLLVLAVAARFSGMAGSKTARAGSEGGMQPVKSVVTPAAF